MTRRSGSFITETPSLPTTNSGGGIWPIMEASQNVGNGRWPYYIPPSVYTINNSLRFRNSASAYFNRTFGSGNRKTWTFSVWVKRGKLGDYYSIFSQGTGTLSNGYGSLRFNSDDTLFFFGSPDNSVNSVTWTTSGVFRDTSAWYHIVAVLDTTQSTSSNRFKLWVNGVLQAGSFGTTPTQNADIELNRASTHLIAAANAGGFGQYNDCYLSEMNFIDGQALTASSFGETSTTTGVWSPKQYTGSYGTNGFYLKFNNTASTTTLGYDSSGNGNNWTTNNISLTAGATYDAMLDVPTPVSATVGNYCVLNNIGSSTVGVNTFSDGNLAVQQDRSSSNPFLKGTMAVNSGKWYWEVKVTSSNIYAYIGVVDVTLSQSTATTFLGLSSTPVRAWNLGDGTLENGNLYPSRPSYGTGGAQNDTVGVALDLDNGKIYFSKNGTWQGSGDPVAGTNAAFTNLVTSGYTWTPFAAINSATLWNGVFNFGQRPFTYTPPTGFKALNTYNLPEPTIVNGAGYMAATLYTGTNSNQSISNSVNGVSFQPDFVWIKERSSTGHNVLQNVITLPTHYLISNSTGAEGTDGSLTAFNSNGFSLTTDPGVSYNASGGTYVGWQWKGGGTAVTNTNGSITSQVSANPTAGFSVVSWTYNSSGGTIGHGLGVAPSFMIVKNRSGINNWDVYHTSIGPTKRLMLNLTDAAETQTGPWNNTAPTSSVFTQGSSWYTNGVNLIGYIFAAISGYSAFGSYTGNGSTDGPFVYCGFRPRWILIKRSDASGPSWWVLDSSRSTYNVVTAELAANLSDAETSGDNPCDFVANGFKCRSSWGGSNTNGATYIYAAFAENPFKYSLAR